MGFFFKPRGQQKKDKMSKKKARNKQWIQSLLHNNFAQEDIFFLFMHAWVPRTALWAFSLFRVTFSAQSPAAVERQAPSLRIIDAIVLTFLGLSCSTPVSASPEPLTQAEARLSVLKAHSLILLSPCGEGYIGCGADIMGCLSRDIVSATPIYIYILGLYMYLCH